MAVRPIQDNTYMTYCSRLRKYRNAYEETKNDFWKEQVIKLEAKILACGRELPKDREKPSTAIEPLSELQTREVAMYKGAYERSVKQGDTKRAEDFKTVLAKLGVVVGETDETKASA
jgi:hypothetical protein